MTKAAAPAKPRGAKKPAAPIAAETSAIVPSSPIPVALGRLRRAPENVRHIRIDEDVEGLADDITTHGLLSSLIGYDASWPEDGDRVFIVGGGRRLQALELLRDRGAIDDAFMVPVLIRQAEMAVELSLAENLQQRTMSPVDEFHAFKALMDTGRHSPAELAKRFGFTEKLVKQRLRLAELAEPVLDALANRQITLDAAYAYATTSDKDRQIEVFKRHAKAQQQWSHQPHHVRKDFAAKAITTASPLYKFVGAESYERRGGDYEDDLFGEAGPERVLRDSAILQRAAEEMVAFQADRLLHELRASNDWSPTITGFVVVAGLRIGAYGVDHDKRPAAPAGMARIDKWDHKPMWRTIRNNGLDVRVLVGINPEGQLIAWPSIVYVDEAQQQAIDPRTGPVTRPVETPEQDAARERAEEVEKLAYRLAVPPFAGTAFEGRAFWPSDGWRSTPEKAAREGIPGWLVPVRIFVTDAEVDAQAAAAEKAYDEEIASKTRDAEQAEQRQREAEAIVAEKAAALRDMEPPAVAVINGEVWLRAQDDSYAPVYDDVGSLDDWKAVLEEFEQHEIDATYATREAFDAAMAAAGAAPAMAEAAE